MKRCASADSDNDVFYDDNDIKVGSPSQSCHRSDRKRRRGVIEKRRRDRINNSLTELRRLVPAAFEKQDSAKLEKAEILQMTVDHLKTLHNKALGGAYNIDTAALAMDYRLVGFRECAAEVARYLVSIEGLDVQDPLRLRLMSHLQCYCTQREAAAKVASSLPSATPSQHPWCQSQYPAATSSLVSQQQQQQHQHQQQLHLGSQNSDQSTGTSYLDASRHHGDPNNMRLTSSSNMAGLQMVPGCSASSSASSSAYMMTSAQCGPPLLPALHPSVQHAAQFFGAASVNSMPMLSPNGLHYGSSAAMLGQGVKPYRPWGAELAY